MSVLLNRLVVLAAEVVAPPEPAVDNARKGIQCSRPFRFCDRLTVPANQRQIIGVPVVSVGIVGIQIDGPLKFALGFSKVSFVIKLDKCQGGVAFRQGIVKLERLRDRRLCSGKTSSGAR